MKTARTCLYCYQPLDNNQTEYHTKCSKIFFGTADAPIMPYALNELENLAKDIIKQSITIPGVQEKLSLHLEKNQNAQDRLTLVGLWGDYILKPPAKNYPEIAQIEDLTMHLASLWKIPTVPHCMIRLRSGELAYITKRIDRNKNRKIYHMEDMCQLTEHLTEHKYRSSMEKIAKAINRYSSHPLFDITTYFRITLFSFLTGNADMHLKNFSLYYNDDNLIQLTPAYDLVATRLLIKERDDSEELALTLNGKKAKFRRKDFDIFANNIGLNEKQISNSYNHIEAQIDGALNFIDLSFISDDKKIEFKELIISRATRIGLFSKKLNT